MFSSLKVPLIIFLIFWAIALSLWQVKGNAFFLLNFGYLGTAIGFGIGLYQLLPRKKKPMGRRLAQLLVGIYMLGFLGLLEKENMQLEGFFLYLMSGIFSGAVIHYMVAKIAGPLFFGRGFCGWACWTAMMLDLLPYKRNRKGRVGEKWEHLRGIHFAASLLLVLLLWFGFSYRPSVIHHSELSWLLAGNAFYFLSGIVLAFALKDNRAFCKYLCPITVFLKTTSRPSLLKIRGDQNKCTACGACTLACPMDIDVMAYVSKGERVLSTECIFCLTCTTVCPEQIIDSSFRFDMGGQEKIRRAESSTPVNSTGGATSKGHIRSGRLKKVVFWVAAICVFSTSAVTIHYAWEVCQARLYTIQRVIPKEQATLYPLGADSLTSRQLDILLKIEDPNFFTHAGVDLTTPGAGITTISQTLVKKLYFKQFKPGIAKIKQTLIARFALDSLMPKEMQLRRFINTIWLGPGVEGFEAAANYYFHRSLDQLSEEQYIAIVAMIIAPTTFSIEKHPERNRQRVERIKKVVDGVYQPKGLFDLFYGTLDKETKKHIPPLSYFESYYN